MTSGRISIVCSPEILAILQHERAVFDSLYPGAEIDVRQGGSAEGVRALFAAECDLAAVSRELDPVERGAALRGGLDLDGYRFARDGVALIVHPSNPVENLELGEVRQIFTGAIARWSGLGGEESPIRPVVPPAGSDLLAFFANRVMDGEAMQAPVVFGDTDSAVAAFVARDRNAIGLVSMAWSERGVRPLRLATLKGLPYWRPDAETVHRGDYPLWRDMTIYARPDGPALAGGFITFVTSREGQAIVRDAGLVPTAVPVRFVRRSPMMGSHKP